MYILYSESFTITGDVFPKSFGQFTLLYYCNKLFKTKIDLQLSGILLHKVHSTNEIVEQNSSTNNDIIIHQKL